MTRTILGSSPTLWQKRASQVVQRCSKTPRQDRSSRCSGPRRHLVVPTSSRTSVVAGALPDPSLVDARYAPNDFDPSCAVVYRDFITSEEADLIANEMLSRMKRRRYEKGHWDAVIAKYKEIELQDISFMPTDDHDNHPAAVAIASIFERTRQQLEKCHLEYQPVQWLPCHAIDLKKQGELNAHVDSVRFSGDLVAGISLLSPSIMRLMPDNDDSEDKAKEQDTDTIQHLGHVDLFLPPRSLYALTGVGRYRYSHQLLPDASVFTNPTDGVEIKVKRDHRLSIIFRDAKR